MALPDVAVWVDAPYRGDELLDPASPLNRDDCLAPYRMLRDRVVGGGGRLHTCDVFAARGERPDVVLFFDIPAARADRLLPWADVPRWVALFESEVVLPRNWDARRQEEFELVFTWRDPVVDGRRFRKIDFPNVLRPPPRVDPAERRTLATMIAGHKRSSHPLELYSRRLETVRWFERHHPQDFDLYGVGWDRPEWMTPAVGGLLRRAHIPVSLLGRGRPSYRGRVAEKAPTLRRYRFAVCYENARAIPGYVTEKIFDCLMAPVVPIYWGPEEIADRIPPGCFVDRRRFQDHEALHRHLVGMSADAYEDHLEAGRAFLADERAAPYSAERFVDVLTEPMAELASSVTPAARGRGGG